MQPYSDAPADKPGSTSTKEPDTDATRPVLCDSGISAQDERQIMLAEEAREKQLFERILAEAREEQRSLSELHALMRTLALPGQTSQAHRAVAPEPEPDYENQPWLRSMDSEGNPLWITLTIPEREPGRGKGTPDKTAPGPSEKAAGRPTPRAAKPERTPAALWRALTAKDKQQKQQEDSRSYRPRPMRSFFRMLLVTAILGMVYHFLSQKGWVPPLW